MTLPSRAFAIALTTLVAPACRTDGPQSPEELQSRLQQAIEQNDPDAVYRLLSSEAKKQITPEDFRKNWEKYEAERKLMFADQGGDKQSSTQDAANQSSRIQRKVRTPLPNEEHLEWTKMGDRYLISGGLKLKADRTTAIGVLQAFAKSLREQVELPFESFLDRELQLRLRAERKIRAQAIEDALGQPDALVFDRDQTRAVLRYAEDRHIEVTLQKNSDSSENPFWAISELR